MLAKVQQLYNKSNQIYTKERYVFKTQLTVYTQLTYLKKVCAKVRSKKYHLVKQGMQELKVKK